MVTEYRADFNADDGNRLLGKRVGVTESGDTAGKVTHHGEVIMVSRSALMMRTGNGVEPVLFVYITDVVE
jgi:hypothetical protein